MNCFDSKEGYAVITVVGVERKASCSAVSAVCHVLRVPTAASLPISKPALTPSVPHEE